MKIAFIFLITFTLQSCSSVSDLREKKPLVEYSSPKSSDSLLECISSKWNEHNNPFTTSKIKDGWSLNLINTDFHSSYAVVDIVKNNEGTRVKYFEQAMLGIEWPEKGVRDCEKI